MSRSPGDDDPQAVLELAAAWLRKAKCVAVLTGAGVSAESGVPTFRGSGSLWEGNRVEEVATPMAFRVDPAQVWRFYNAPRAGLRQVKPNAGHLALVELEKRFDPAQFALITQNVDGLHRAAGSQRVLELHGSISRVRCTGCGVIENRGHQELPELPSCEHCQAPWRPDIVWFHEMLPQDVWMEAEAAARSCQCFLVVGTSAVIYPAAGLVAIAQEHGATVIEINLERTPASDTADISLLGPSGQVLPAVLKLL